MKCRITHDQPLGTPDCGQNATHVAIRYGSQTIGAPPDNWEISPGGYGKPAGEGYVRAYPVCPDHASLASLRGDQVVEIDDRHRA